MKLKFIIRIIKLIKHKNHLIMQCQNPKRKLKNKEKKNKDFQNKLLI